MVSCTSSTRIYISPQNVNKTQDHVRENAIFVSTVLHNVVINTRFAVISGMFVLFATNI